MTPAPLAFDLPDSGATEALGRALAQSFPAADIGAVVHLRGELGSGKTTLVRGAAQALGVTDPITSPTFSIGHRYRAAALNVSHLDLYRLAGLGDEDPALLEDYLGDGRIAFVEWPVADNPELAAAPMRVTLSHLGAERRRIELEGERIERAAAIELPR